MRSVCRMCIAVPSILAAVCGASVALADVNVTVDPGQTWLGYMNVFDLPVGSGGYVFGSPWGTPDLAATFLGPNLRLSPNTNTYNAADAFWVQPNGAGNKWMNANMYVENPALVGQNIVFRGQTLLNNFAAGYTSQAFIKVLDPAQGYATILETYAPLVGGQNFTLSLLVPNTPGLLPQYGFVTDGANANPATVDALGSAIIGPIPEPASLLLVSLAGVVLLRRR
ncbi:MAG: PEP-CTERM sorting domain-containing protein [Phycisphaerae bacterium]